MIIDLPKAPAFKVDWDAPEFGPSDANAVCCSICGALCLASACVVGLVYLIDLDFLFEA
jgi:hypothetical protein